MGDVVIKIGEGEALALKMAYLLGRDDCASGRRTDGSDVVPRVMQTLREMADKEAARLTPERRPQDQGWDGNAGRKPDQEHPAPNSHVLRCPTFAVCFRFVRGRVPR